MQLMVEKRYKRVTVPMLVRASIHRWFCSFVQFDMALNYHILKT
jgi:hypothetical protein